MKKIIAIVLAVSSLFFLTVSKTLAEVTLGFSISHGLYQASGTETEGSGNVTSSEAAEVSSATTMAKFTYPTIFAEYNTGMVSIGVEVIPGSVETEEVARTDYNIEPGQVCTGNDGCNTSVTNKVEIEISKHITLYGLLPIMSTGAYLKAGISRMDVETNESLGTGSTYADIDGVSGAHASLGYQHDTASGFVRAEIGYSIYENMSVTSSNSHKVEADIEGGFARISIGRSF